MSQAEFEQMKEDLAKLVEKFNQLSPHQCNVEDEIELICQDMMFIEGNLRQYFISQTCLSARRKIK
ncbi:hypothetical protein [Vibrio marisflavi]|uniref:Uncharacterized protein n=1 Tax=Vibrio marisflavi CECT 7928 TaxID=634439 RepID=A0ABN8E2X2_9VIBR|nr:hypothetical protein [Vibrio marisflavi]CAH0539515.1 hypothetical protein VMF7928_02211 [Vibrio marisflavi CECT 7928]